MNTTIQINSDVRNKLEEYKIHQRESLNEVLSRILFGKQNSENKVDIKNLIATIEVLQDPRAMREIKESLEEINKGNYGISLENLEKELGI